MNSNIFELEYRIPYYDVDYQKRTLITSLINYFNDIAFVQSENLGGIAYLTQNNLGWVLMNWDIKVDRYPRFNERVLVRTAPHSFNKFFAYRWFEIYDKDEIKIAKANSRWLLINTEKRRPVKINDYLYGIYGVSYENNNILPIEEPQKLLSIDIEKQFEVRYSDLDSNGHANNVKYVVWALDTVPLEIISNYSLKRLKVKYEKEVTYGKTVRVLTGIFSEQKTIVSLHKIVDEDETELCFLESVWFLNEKLS
ncbi:acyl-[acyl-carrier-protein] thioesterase [Carboxydothermus pertinax]|uniref:Acyl-ACP thioesterase n=1 Tax=Carboxydothermus pertinax TaxID=870242 RepID=A0A1L8CV50_9THEO|nr:acyl-ACP thioesterase domain-containing protein [Carboxydothermus pertinax]GAV22729.1 acyl-ACP thioesterase [Carboxydothermus pertinax]